jgi:hypothetical protein
MGKELLPSFVEKTDDLQNFADAIGEFLAPYIYQFENFSAMADLPLLKEFAEQKGLLLNGYEDADILKGTLLPARLRTMFLRGTSLMIDEIRRVCSSDNIGLNTSQLLYIQEDRSGWILGVTSPDYIAETELANYCYLGISRIVIFYLKNLTRTKTNDALIQIMKTYFEPKGVDCLYIFQTDVVLAG